MNECSRAAELDAIAALRCPLEEVPARCGWAPLLHFWQHGGARSFVARELDPRTSWTAAEWLLADVVDLLQALCFGLSGRKGKKPRPIARPAEKKRHVEATPADLNARMANLFKKA